MKLTLKLASILLLIPILLTACGSTAPTPMVVDLTAGVNTMVASFFGIQTAQAATVAAQATATFTPVPPTATYLPPPTALPLPSPTIVFYYPSSTPAFITPTFIPLATGTQPTITVVPGALAFGCNDLAFVRDVDYPSGTEVQPGENFSKTWKVMNTGTCDWLYQYSLEFLSANYPEGGSYKLQRIVTVNDWAEISVNLDARKNPGTYTSYWRMSDGAGHMFGATLTASYVIAQP
ncbi:MAG: NBR1-Ig-like domain-containing protein [Anaerolineales bacterium]|nr:NBR1-Ig-like domain-containing protein [Anaerolineales bacterium]